MIKKLTQANPVLFTKWRGGGVSRAAAMHNMVPLTYEGIKRLLAERYYVWHDDEQNPGYAKKKLKRNDQDEDHADYSFSGGLWNAHDSDGETASIGFTLGSPEPEQWSNHCMINLPYEGPQYEYYCQPANRQVLIQLLEEHWHPEEISLFFNEFAED